jgi:hypothetical protein
LCCYAVRSPHNVGWVDARKPNIHNQHTVRSLFYRLFFENETQHQNHLSPDIICWVSLSFNPTYGLSYFCLRSLFLLALLENKNEYPNSTNLDVLGFIIIQPNLRFMINVETSSAIAIGGDCLDRQ